MIEELKAIGGCIATMEEAMKARYAMKTKVVGNHLLLDYNMIESPRKHPIVDLCRGVVFWVNPADPADVRYARRPFDRFYNYGEWPEREAEFEWRTAVVEEKADGSLICVWFNHEAMRWELGTRGNAFGDNHVSTLTGEDSTITFRELFLRAFGGERRFENAYSVRADHVTDMYELCTIENKIVTPYDGDQVFLLAARRLDGTESSPEALDKIAKVLGVRRPERFPISTFEDAVTAANELMGLREGFVLRDEKGQRIKVKSMAYVAAHHLRGEGVTEKRAVMLALGGEVDEFCSYFPEYKPLLEPYQRATDETIDAILNTFDALRGIEEQKAFAAEALKHRFSSVLFSMRKGHSLDDVIRKLSENSKLAIFSPRAA